MISELTAHGSNAVVLKEPKRAWASQTSMGKERRYIGRPTKISANGQITIPRLLMKELGLRPHDILQFGWISFQKPTERRISVRVLRNGKRVLRATVYVRQYS